LKKLSISTGQHIEVVSKKPFASREARLPVPSGALFFFVLDFTARYFARSASSAEHASVLFVLSVSEIVAKIDSCFFFVCSNDSPTSAGSASVGEEHDVSSLEARANLQQSINAMQNTVERRGNGNILFRTVSTSTVSTN
jgi:hypothetical protein